MALMCYDREMHMRKSYNEERILQVETEKMEEAIGKLVPIHILEGIKRDKKVIDKLDHVSILFARLRCTNGNSKSLAFTHEYTSLVQELFAKFDMLCELRQVLKVHSYGDVYVLMSYKGKVRDDERLTNVLVTEAYETLRMAFEMLESVMEMREKGSPLIRDIDLQIGIHTGKILGGLIGQSFVRYDIFGQDVLIA